jgi:predicted small metal-binding protein
VDSVLSCECGFVACGAGEEELVLTVQRHASKAHGMVLSLDQARQLVTRARRGRDSACDSSRNTRIDEEET